MSSNKNTTRQRKKILIEALEKSLGVVSTACKAVGIPRGTYYTYLKKDPKFAAAVEDIEALGLDFVESALYRRVQDGDTTAIIFYLKTKGKKRGYGQNVTVDGNLFDSLFKKYEEMDPGDAGDMLDKLAGTISN